MPIVFTVDLQNLGDFIEYNDGTILVDINYIKEWRADCE